MEGLIDFGRGPLFRFSFTLMLLLWLRFGVMALGMGWREGRRDAGRSPSAAAAVRKWLHLTGRLWVKRPLRSLLATAYHMGLLAVPLFSASHVLEWRRGVNFSWWHLPTDVAQALTLTVIGLTPVLIALRLLDRNRAGRATWTFAIYMFFLGIPFVTGYLCHRLELSPAAYQVLMAVHVYSGNSAILLVSLTDVARCIQNPLAEVIGAVGGYLAARTTTHATYGGNSR